jgi:hypothetical protein
MAGRFLAIAVVLLSASNFSLSAVDGIDAPEVVVLVEKLGASSFKARMKAAEQLVAIGSAAQPILEASRNHADPEIRQRVARVLSRIKSADATQRIAAFKANPSRKTVAQLPGWNLFAAIAGYSDESVACFGRMFESEQELFENHSPQRLAGLLSTRVTELERQFAARRKEPIPVDRLHALLMTSSRREIPVTPATARSLMKLVNRPGFIMQIRKRGTKQSQSRDITAHWISSCEVVDSYSRLQLAMSANIESGLHPALAILRSRSAPIQKQYAILAVAKLGTIDNVTDLEALLNDTGKINIARSVPGNQKGTGRTITSRVSDIALAAIWHLHGERPEDHGFPAIRRNSIYVFALNQIRFESDKQRESAIRLWDEFKSEQ